MKRFAAGLAIGVAALGTLMLAMPGAAPAPAAVLADTAVLAASIDYLEERLLRDPGNPLISQQLANRYVLRFQRDAMLEDLERAEALERAALTLAPDAAAGRARLSAVLLMSHDFTGAYGAATDAVGIDSTSRAARGALFDAAFAIGNYAQADSLLGLLDADDASTRIRRSLWLDAIGETRTAARVMQRVCDRLERTAAQPQLRAWCITELAGMAHGYAGARGAEQLLRRALRVMPNYRGAVEGLADLAHARGRWKEAERLYRRIATDAHPDLYLRLAEVQRARGNQSSAHAWEQRFLRVAQAPGNERLHARTIALFYADRAGTRDLALAIAQRDAERRPTVESWDVLSWVHYRRGELKEALEASDRARTWGAPSPTMDYRRGRIFDALGRTEQAEALLLQASRDPTQLDPDVRAGG